MESPSGDSVQPTTEEEEEEKDCRRRACRRVTFSAANAMGPRRVGHGALPRRRRSTFTFHLTALFELRTKPVGRLMMQFVSYVLWYDF